MKSADQFRREGLADAAVLLVAGKVVPTMTLEEWARPLGLTHPELRAAVDRWKAKQYAAAGVRPGSKKGHLQAVTDPAKGERSKSPRQAAQAARQALTADRRLQGVAVLYRAAQAAGKSARASVAEELGVGKGQAGNLIVEARRRGYITDQPADAGDYPCSEDGCSHVAHTKRGAAVHARTHIPMTCPKCGRVTNAAGYGRHVSLCGGAGGDAA